MKDREIFDKAISQWGFNAQVLMLAEEAEELSLAALHLLRRSREAEALHELAEEIADTELMIKEIKYYLVGHKLDKLVRSYRVKKRRRLIAKLEGGK